MKNINLKKYNSYKLDCIAKEVHIPNDVEELLNLLKFIKENNLKYKMLGGGSNVIFSKKEYDGIIIKLNNFNKLEINKDEITVGSGYNIIKLILTLANKNVGGLEFASALPGTIGGAIYNNAGAYQNEIGNFVTEVTVITPDLEIKKLNNYSRGYRTSYFKENKDYIIIEVKLKTKSKEKEIILKEINEKRIKRKNSQPLNYPSAGSVFRNPDGDYAGRLIESLNLKGKTIGGAKISEKHANFIINTGSATGEDIVNLINLIKKEVKNAYGIDLELEQEIID